MTSWWHTTILPIIAFMRQADYPEVAVQSYTAFFQAAVLPLLGPAGEKPLYASWMTDDHTPLEFSLIVAKTGERLIRFSIEPYVLAHSGDTYIGSLRDALLRLSVAITPTSPFSLDWFDICAEELLSIADMQVTKPGCTSQTFIGFDCAHDSVSMKVYFIPRIRALATKELPEEMLARTVFRLQLEKPWEKIAQFLSRFLPGDQPEAEIVAVDCVPGHKNRLKIYFRTHIFSFSHLEFLLTLGGTVDPSDVSDGLHKAHTLWNAVTANGPSAGSFRYFRSALVYYELRSDSDNPSSKVYLPIQRYLPNDLVAAKAIDCLGSYLPGFSSTNPYSRFTQAVFDHRALSARAGIHTYACCTVKPVGSEISLYYNPEAFAQERMIGLRGLLNTSAQVPSSPDAQNIATLFTREWESLVNGNVDAAFCLASQCCVRDLLVFSSTFRMLEGKERVVQHIRSASRNFSGFTVLGQVAVKAVSDNLQMIQGRIRFEDDCATYTAVFTLFSKHHDPWQCWALFTVLEGLKNRPRQNIQIEDSATMYDTIVVGAGQAGLTTAARLKQLGLRVCVIERNGRVGDAWRVRYKSLEFNTPKDFSHLPYFPFPENWSMFPAARLVADHLEQYPQVLQLDVRTSTEAIHANYDDAGKTWTIELQCMDGSKSTLHTSHLVVATGVDILGGHKPKIPQIPGLENFRGQVLHSTEVRDVSQWIGKRVVVFGAGCSAHDICLALSRQGAADVTMVQRSPTAVISREVLLRLFPDMYTGENKPSIHVADELYLALPTPVSKLLRGAMMEKLALLDADLHCKLRNSGFKLPEENDFIERLTVRRGGYYIDQGCSALISNGTIKLRSYQNVESMVSNGIIFTDGQKLSAEVIVFATGFEPDSKPGPFLAESVHKMTSKIGSIDEEGEATGLWRPSGHEQLWFAGGDFFTCRFYSRLLALQIAGVQGHLSSGLL
ncbi:Pyr-redox-2 domain-containing protein [Favolaschia claudopus]|uniref:Pyr-redox-2 domain-containing protein n=1 Tax=Favolaschia claudopus TaxID=2862362 RepID=A0AAW0DBY9_9AGAR